jgi:hypothetical protein
MQRLFFALVLLFSFEAKAVPLVVAIHGYGMNPQWMRQLVGQVEKEFPDAGYFYMTSAPSLTWDQQRHYDDFYKLVEWSKPLFDKVFIIGYSAGGFFGNKLKADGFVQIAAGGTTDMPVMIIHGREDQTIPFSTAITSVALNASNRGCTPIIDPMLDQVQIIKGCKKPIWFRPWPGNHHFPAEVMAKEVAAFFRSLL